MDTAFIDLQVNGYMGINFSDPGLGIDDIRKVSALLGDRGVAAYCPTIISASLETYRHNLPILASATRENAPGARILGIHLEGPFLNPQPGPRGIHEAGHIHRPDSHLYDLLLELSRDSLSMITVAPDQPGAIGLIRHITSTSKTVVSLGHHLSTQTQIEEAADAGATAATHVGNGLPTMIHRHQNPLWPILSDDRICAMFITDGFHLPKPLIDVILKVKPPEKLVLTSDLMHLGGMEPGRYRIGSLPVQLEENGKLHQEQSSQLAGAALPIDRCAEYLKNSCGVSEEQIYSMAYENPLKLLNITL